MNERSDPYEDLWLKTAEAAWRRGKSFVEAMTLADVLLRSYLQHSTANTLTRRLAAAGAQ